jgi:EmrB/QacA subfamily drug resistance transporter
MTDLSNPEAVASDDPVEEGKQLHLGWALVLISMAQLMVVLDASIANIALPFIGGDLNIADANLTWIVTGYALAFGGLLLLGGRLGDLYGRRRVFMIGLAVFAVASFIGGFAQNEAMLLASRGLQGLGAALASPAALALITTTFPAGPARNRAFAVYAAMSGAGAAVGLILGGWLTGLDPVIGLEGWRLTFLINVPIGLVAAFLAPRFLRESESHPGELDVPGAITGTLGLLGLVYGFSRAGEAAHGWDDPWTLASLGAGVALLAVFAFIESRVKHPLLPVRVFNNRTRATSFLVMALVPAAMFSMFYFLSLFIQLVIGYSPLRTGFAFLPFSVGIVIGAGISSNLVNRIDARYIAGVGTLMAAVALFGFSRLSVPSGTDDLLAVANGGGFLGADVNYWSSIFPFIVLMSIGMGLTFVPLTLTAVHHLRTEDSGIGSGVLNTMQQVGGALGLAILGTVSLHYADGTKGDLTRDLVDKGVPAKGAEGLAYLGSFTDGATAAFVVGGVLIALGSLATWLFLNVKHTELATDGPETPVHVG